MRDQQTPTVKKPRSSSPSIDLDDDDDNDYEKEMQSPTPETSKGRSGGRNSNEYVMKKTEAKSMRGERSIS